MAPSHGIRPSLAGKANLYDSKVTAAHSHPKSREVGGGDRRAPLVSVVIPTYNRWPLVLDSVRSVLDQEFADFEVVVVDDHSPDGTAERLRGIDPRVRVVAQAEGRPETAAGGNGATAERSGLGRRGAARNQGIAGARGTYVAFLDDDDLYEPWHLAQFARALAHAPGFEVFASKGWYWDPDTGRRRPFGAFDAGSLATTTLLGTMVSPVVLIASRRALLDVGGFPEAKAMDGGEDWFLMMKLAARYPFRPLPRPSVRVRMHPGRSMNRFEHLMEAREAITEAVLKDGLLGQPLDEEAKRLLVAGTHRFCAGHLYAAGDMDGARARLRQAGEVLGWRRGVPWVAKLWVQTWMGPAVSSRMRTAKQRLTWR